MEQEKDIVERLRHCAFPNQTSFDGLFMEAANEIERLRGALLRWSCPQCRMLGKGWGTAGGVVGIRKQEQTT
jgi:hypothetical protein